MTEMWIASYILLWLIVAGLAVFVVGLLRQLGMIQMRLGLDSGVLITPEGLDHGIEAPDFGLIDPVTNAPLRLRDLRGRRVVIVFLAPGCSACRVLAPHLNEIARDERGAVEVVAICNGGGVACAEFARLAQVRVRFVSDPGNSIGTQYGVKVTPFAFLLDELGRILIRGVVNSWPHLDALLLEEGTFQGQSWQPVHGPSGPPDTGDRMVERVGAP